ncbi:MAG TPA: hypothetical protein VKH17_07790 [Acidimicrobiia bacterium]|nr:hypothetical protein [Acidimicrobiia bacterium]
MSTLWTPGGEQQPEDQEQPEASAGVGPDDEAAREQLRQLREQLAATPVADIIANHAIGLWELALLHLSPDEGMPPDLDEARLAVDGVAALVEGLGDRLGRHQEPLREALAQLRLAFVEISRRAGADTGDHEAGDESG